MNRYLSLSARVLALAAIVACDNEDDPSGPLAPLDVPAFAFVSDVGGVWQIFR